MRIVPAGDRLPHDGMIGGVVEAAKEQPERRRQLKGVAIRFRHRQLETVQRRKGLQLHELRFEPAAFAAHQAEINLQENRPVAGVGPAEAFRYHGLGSGHRAGAVDDLPDERDAGGGELGHQRPRKEARRLADREAERGART